MCMHVRHASLECQQQLSPSPMLAHRHTPPLHPRSGSASPLPSTPRGAVPAEAAAEQLSSPCSQQQQLAAAADSRPATLHQQESAQALHEGTMHGEVAASVGAPSAGAVEEALSTIAAAALAQRGVGVGAAPLAFASPRVDEADGCCSSVPGSPAFDDSFAAEAQRILGSLVTPAPNSRAAPPTPFLGRLAASMGPLAAAAAAAAKEEDAQVCPPRSSALAATCSMVHAPASHARHQGCSWDMFVSCTLSA